MTEKKILGGYVVKARKIKNSPVHKMPPYVREIWDYCLREANHSRGYYGPYIIERGQLFRAYKDIREDLSWYIGYRKVMYNENHTKKAMKALREARMITTSKELGGVLITILKYDFYQDPKNYESTKERTTENTTKEPLKNHPIPDNNKKNKNEKNNKNIEDIPQNEFAEDDQEEFYLTKKKRKLIGKRLETFLQFWEAFDYKKDKASAADSWIDIPELTDKLVDKICESAKSEFQNRSVKISNGQTPIYAQGWLTAKRWEDQASSDQASFSSKTNGYTTGVEEE